MMMMRMTAIAWIAAAALAPARVDAATERERVAAMVAELPTIGRVDHERFRVVVRGRVAAGSRAATLALARQVVGDVAARFTDNRGTAHPEVTLCVFDDGERYRAAAHAFDHVPSDWGFYDPQYRVAVANLAASIGNLRHELTHPLTDDDFPNMPAWLAEGIGSLYGTARWNGKRFEFLLNYRLRDLQRAIASQTLPTIRQLASSSAGDVRGEQASVYYAMSRYVLLYLEQRGQLGEVYRGLRAAKPAEWPAIVARHLDDATFVAWARKLKF